MLLKCCTLYASKFRKLSSGHRTENRQFSFQSLKKAMPKNVKLQLTGKDPDAGKDWRQGKKEMTEDEMFGWHHQLIGHEFEEALWVGDGQEGLECCSPWGCKELDTTELILNVSKVMLKILQARLQKYVNQELPDVQVDFRKGKEPEIKLPTFIRS